MSSQMDEFRPYDDWEVFERWVRAQLDAHSRLTGDSSPKTGTEFLAHNEESKVMAENVRGFVEKIWSKQWAGKGGKPPQLSWTAVLADPDGTEHGIYYQLGWSAVNEGYNECKEGDWVQFTVEPAKSDNARKVTQVKVGKNPPARSGGGSSSDGATASRSGSYNGAAASAQRAYHAARAAAIEFVTLAATTKALKKLTDESVLAAAVDKYTVRFFRDAVGEGFEDTYRLLADVSDDREDEEEEVIEVPDAPTDDFEEDDDDDFE